MEFVWLTFYSQINTIKVMSNMVVNLHTLYPDMLRPPKQFTNTKSTYFCQLMTTALLDSAVVRECCRSYLMTNLHKSYLAGHGFDITTPGLKTDYRSAALPTVLPGLVNMHASMYMCVRAQVCACLSVRVCMWGDGQTDRGWRDRWI